MRPSHSPCNGLRCDRPALAHSPSHIPRGKGEICLCGAYARYHRPTHKPKPMSDSDICECGAYVSLHKQDKRQRKGRIPSDRTWVKYLMIDGEGIGRKPHRYVILAASDESGKRQWHIADPNGLSSVDCLDFILSLPQDAKTFAYSFNYDITKILQDLPDDIIFRLFRPEKRRDKEGKIRAVHWGQYRLNLVSTKLTIQRGKRRRVIWDLFKFFQCRFVAALTDWGIKADIDSIQSMKEKRSEFSDTDMQTMIDYCLSECRAGSALARKLIEAHNAVDMPLKTFYGPGSTATSLFYKHNIKEQIFPHPDDMHRAATSAFYGGRFEQSVIGAVKGPIYAYDISSAYPYHTTFLPCLVCSVWRKGIGNSEDVSLIRWEFAEPIPPRAAWAPLPHRDEWGQITYPRLSGGGWVWDIEFRAAQKAFPDKLRAVEAWHLKMECEHHPFSFMPAIYRYRKQLGKDGKGIVIKLGYNSVYGKLAQSVGNATFQSWVWAGLITAGCRAQILEAMAQHKKRSNLLGIATDGIYTKERLTLPPPIETDTGPTKPLGGWEEKVYEHGVFFVRPGVYFPLDDDAIDVRARGIGRNNLLEQRQHIIDAFNAGKESVILSSVIRFHGAKTSIHYRQSDNEFIRSEHYGDWTEREIKLSFSPKPKREHRRKDNTLSLVTLEQDNISKPYSRAALQLPDGSITETGELVLAQEIESEQPD